MRLPSDGYRKQSGCMDCKSVFLLSDYEEGIKLYCTDNAPPRPSCDYRERFHDSLHKWEEWSKDREVTERGICNKWIVA